LREERTLRVFGNRVMTKIFGPKRDKGTGKWRKLHNEEFCDLYCAPNIILMTKSRRMRWVWHVEEKHIKGFGGARRPFGRSRRRWGDNNKIDLQVEGWRGMDLIDLSQDMDRWRALLNAVINLWVP
jgi:hypothetical protein